MTWDASLTTCIVNTLLVGGSTALLASVLAALTAILVVWYRIPGFRIFLASVASLVLVPVYVQASAWSAGFGTQGWWRLSQVDAAKYPSWGKLSVIWIHTSAAIPVCFLIIAVGLWRIPFHVYEQAIIERGAGWALRNILLRRLTPWICGAAFWAFCITQNDMVVTNLFQVPTITESVYQQVQFGNLRTAPILSSIVLSFACGCVLGGIAASFRGAFRGRSNEHSGFKNFSLQNTSTRVFLTGLVTVIVALVVWIPLMNLIGRMGWDIQQSDGFVVRAWSFVAATHAILSVTTFAPEMSWSIQLSIACVAVSVLLSLAILPLDRNRISTFALGLILGTMIAMPGPIVNLAVLRLLDQESPEWVGYLADRTLAGPILALQFRCLPVCFLVLWISTRRYEQQFADLLRMERDRKIMARWILWLRYSMGSIGIASMIVFFVAFADLSSYLLVQPPGVTTVAMRMFDLLHYGIRNREASLALVLAIASGVPSAVWISRAFR